jgi:hypothetical protein
VTIKGSNFDWRTCAGQSIAPTRIDIRKTILEYTEKDLDRVVTLNLKGTFYFFQAFGRLVIEQGAGSIIACSSVRAVTIDPGLAVYGSTKAAIGLLVWLCVGGWPLWRPRQCDCAEHRRDGADRHPPALRRAHRVQSME